MGLARRLHADGARVRFHVSHESYRRCGQGLVPLADSDVPAKGALVIFDATGHGALGKFLRAKGHPVIGGNPFDKVLEVDRAAGAAIMAKAGMKFPETMSFKTIKEAVRFLEREDGAWYAKFSGDHATGLTHGARSSIALIRYLRWLASKHDDLTQGVEIQRKVDGVLVDVEGFFHPRTGFVPPFNITLEDKRAHAGNTGPNSGAEISAVSFLDGDAPPLAKATVMRLAEILAEQGYCAPVGVNMIIQEGGTPRVLEASARLGWDAFLAYMHLFDDTLADQLRAFAEGELERWEPVDEDAISLTLRMSCPPYPMEEHMERPLKDAEGLPLDPALLTLPLATVVDVMIGPDGGPVLAGTSGHIGTVGAVGRDIKALRKAVLEQARSLDIPGLQFRVDPVRRAERDWAALVEHGFLERVPSESGAEAKDRAEA